MYHPTGIPQARRLRSIWRATCLLFVLPAFVNGQAIAWREPRLLQAGAGSPREPFIAVAGTQVVAIWGRSATQRIEVTASADGGATWQTPHVLDSGAGSAITPRISMAGARVVAVWIQQENKAQYIGVSCSTDGGMTWQPAQRLSPADGRADNARVILSGSQAVAAWTREDGGLVTARSTDGGVTWEPAQTISVGAGKVADPCLAISGSRVVAVWGQDTGSGMDLYSSCSVDGGQHWLTPQLVEQGPEKVYAGVAWPYCPQVAMAGTNATAIWVQDQQGKRTVFFNHSADAGQTWGAAQSFGGTYYPHIAMSDTSAVAVWVAGSVLASCSTDGGATWQPPQLIEAGGRPADNAAVAISGSRVVAVWRQHDGTQLSDFSNVSLDGGKTWQTPQQMDTSSAMGWYPQVAIDGERAAALWMHLTTDRHWSVFVNYSNSGGQRWQAPRIVASHAGDTGEPCVALAGTRALMLWPRLEQEHWMLRAASSTDRGDTWQVSAFTAPVTGPANSAAAALAGNRAVAVWRQVDGAGIAAANSTDGGATWESTVQIAAADGNELTSPAVAVSEEGAVAVWRRGNGVIETGCSVDGGKIWSKPLSIYTGTGVAEPQVAIVGRQVVATWIVGAGREFSTWVARSTDGGKSWEKAQALQSGIKIVGGPRVAVAGSRAVGVWRENDGEVNRIYASYSGDGGGTWSRAAPVHTGFGNAWGPSVSFVDSRILVIWKQREERASPLTEYSHQSMQNTQYGCSSADGGKTWSAPQIIRSGFGESVTPVMAIDGPWALAGYVSNDGSLWTLYSNTGAVTLPETEGK